MAIEVDLVILTPSDAPLRKEVTAALARQAGVKIITHRVIAAPRPDDANRWATIARGRNQARRLGTSGWLMFLDEDVVPSEKCVATLVEQLTVPAAVRSACGGLPRRISCGPAQRTCRHRRNALSPSGGSQHSLSLGG